MEDSFKIYMTGRTNAELENYLINTKKFTPEAVNAAIAELENRGRVFGEDELVSVKEIINQKLEARAKLEQEESVLSDTLTLEAEIPEYYSNRAVYFFSIFFSVIFGAVLLSINIWQNKSARWNVIGFGLLYTATAMVLLNLFEITTGWSILVNAVGGAILTSYFWNKYLGLSIKYKSKPIWKPLVISLLISAPFVIAVLYSMKIAQS